MHILIGEFPILVSLWVWRGKKKDQGGGGERGSVGWGGVMKEDGDAE